jgi:flagellar motor switch protein FliG
MADHSPAPSPDAPVAPQSEFAKMSKMQKLAALLVVVGPESAAQVLRGLDEHEIEAIISEMAKSAMLSQEVQVEVLREFTEVALQASTSIRAGVDVTQNVLEKAVGLFKATNIITRVAPTRAPLPSVQQIAELEPRQLFNLVKQEQPQTVALVLSYLSAERASQVLALLRPEVREEVVERLATLSPTPIEVVETVVTVLNQKLGSSPTRALQQSGGVKSAAELLNALDKETSRTLLTSIEQRNPELGQVIRQKMFTFEDVALLDTAALQKILREVDMRDLAIALKNASDKLKNALLGCISKRAAETVNEEISFMGPLKIRDIETAQNRIIEVVRRLESEGEIEIGEPGNKNEIAA